MRSSVTFSQRTNFSIITLIIFLLLPSLTPLPSTATPLSASRHVLLFVSAVTSYKFDTFDGADCVCVWLRGSDGKRKKKCVCVCVHLDRVCVRRELMTGRSSHCSSGCLHSSQLTSSFSKRIIYRGACATDMNQCGPANELCATQSLHSE